MRDLIDKTIGLSRVTYIRVVVAACALLGVLAIIRIAGHGETAPAPAPAPTDASAPATCGTPCACPVAAAVPTPAPPLIAHEWGTFTTEIGDDGTPQIWSGPSRDPLPNFVHQNWRVPGGKGGSHAIGTVRMETPVIYFYTPEPQTVSVKVWFPRGVITEWYPQTQEMVKLPNKESNHHEHYAANTASWLNVRVNPKSSSPSPAFDTEAPDNPYYHARDTSSAMLTQQLAGKDETEKFLFYRGIGSFELPLSVRATSHGIRIRSRATGRTPETIAGGFLFERRGDRIGFRRIGRIGHETTLLRPELRGDFHELCAAIEQLLVEQGLYKREARAMVETWRETWFEEGLRVLYLVPRDFTDQVLPLSVSPRPIELVRVLVGRIDFPNKARSASTSVLD
jgi:hypothetical protein